LLFRTVYGPELAAIYTFMSTCNLQDRQPDRTDIHNAFIPVQEKGKSGSPQNVDDAISFLKSADLCQESNGRFFTKFRGNLPFPILLLQALRRLEIDKQAADHPLDYFYLTLVNELFIKTDQTILPDIHVAANQLPSIQEAGGLGKEKLQSWMRVMEYLGVGKRILGNFLCTYSPTLVLNIIHQWPYTQGTLQSFFEDFFATILPYCKSDGELAKSIWSPMQELANNNYIDLYPLQDSPTRPYFGSQRYRGIMKRD
jgi:hypothetical protein